MTHSRLTRTWQVRSTLSRFKTYGRNGAEHTPNFQSAPDCRLKQDEQEQEQEQTDDEGGWQEEEHQHLLARHQLRSPEMRLPYNAS
jgi:hypothetical protein